MSKLTVTACGKEIAVDSSNKTVKIIAQELNKQFDELGSALRVEIAEQEN